MKATTAFSSTGWSTPMFHHEVEGLGHSRTLGIKQNKQNSGSRELKKSRTPTHPHTHGLREPLLQMPSQNDRHRCRPSTQNTHKDMVPHMILTRRTILSPCKTTTTWHCSTDFMTLQEEPSQTNPPFPDTSSLAGTVMPSSPHVLPGRGCWCTAAAGKRGAFPGLWPVEP